MKVISMNNDRERTNKLFLPPDREEGGLRTAITFLEAAQTLLDADEDERKAWLQDVELQGDLAEAELRLCERGPEATWASAEEHVLQGGASRVFARSLPRRPKARYGNRPGRARRASTLLPPDRPAALPGQWA